ncbi:MAG: hypothetical protein CFH07_02005 [Alphaproteobacteria bacterium MarineAlpha3_Bin6]|nr:MAG: hypothetical protein CFH07_02005 [Alphaproteobacteria bacterium MarineAlpha3_Bin6]
MVGKMNRKLMPTLVITMGLAACSSFKIMYDFADDYIKQEAKFFLKFDEQGEQNLNDQVDKMMEWHNAIMLPRYAAYLRQLANQLDHGLYGATAITKGMKDGRILVQITVAGVAPYVARILVRQTIIENIEHLRLKLIERSKEQKEKLARPIEKQTEDRTERLTKNVGRFMGDLNEIQNNLINRYAKSTINDAKRRLDNRNLRQSALLTFLAGKPKEMEIDAFINQIVLRAHEIVDRDYKGYSEKRIARFTTLLVNIFAASTNDQRQATSEKLRSYAQDFSEISN